LSISDEHLQLISRITEGQMNTRTTTDFQPQHYMISSEYNMFKPLKISAEEN